MSYTTDSILSGGCSVQPIGTENLPSDLKEMCQTLADDQIQLEKMLTATQGQLKAPSAEEKSNAPTIALRVAQQICGKNKGLMDLLIRETRQMIEEERSQRPLIEVPASLKFTSTPADASDDLYT